MAAARKLTRQQVDRMCQRYIDGETLLQLARRYDVTHRTVLYHLRRRGIRRRTKKEAMRLAWRRPDFRAAMRIGMARRDGRTL